MDTLDIRILSDSDCQAYFQLRLRALKEEPESFGAAYEESVNTPPAEVAKRLRSTDDSFVLGAFSPKLVGMLGCYRRTGLKVRHKGNIWGMYVAPEARGRGVGQALMKKAILCASALPDMEELLLSVVTSNETARRTYISHGFETYGVEPNALKLGNRYFDEELMALRLIK